MTLMLGICEECKVIEIGTGSGYQTALLAKFTSKVYTVKRIEPLKIEVEKRLRKLGFSNINIKEDIPVIFVKLIGDY